MAKTKTEIEITAKDKTARAFKSATARAKDMDKSVKSLAGSMKALAGGAAAGGVVMVLTAATRSAAAFEKSMAEVSTLVDTSVVSMDALADSVLETNAQFGGGLQEQAAALYGIISAGAEAGAEATDILTQSNKLAVGGSAELAEAAAGLSSVLNAYAANGLTAADASDSLFTAVKAGVTTIPELSASLGKVSAIAQASGVEFDELTASIATLTAGGISTAESVTGLKAALSGMVGPGAEAIKIAKKLGIEMSQADIKGGNFAAVLQDIRDKTGGNIDKMKKLLGSMEAVNAVLILTAEGGGKLNSTLAAMADKAGATEAAYAKMSATISAQWDVLKGKTESASVSIMTRLIPALSAAAGWLIKMTDGLDLVAATTTLDAKTAEMERLTASIAEQSRDLKDLNVILNQTGAANTLSATATEALKITVTGLTAALDDDIDALESLQKEQDALTSATTASTKVTAENKNELDDLAGSTDDAADKIKDITDETKDLTKATKDTATATAAAITPLERYAQSLDKAQADADLLTEKLIVLNARMFTGKISADTHGDALKSLGIDIEGAGDEAEKASEKTTALGESIGEDLAGGMVDAAIAGDDLGDAFGSMVLQMAADWAKAGISKLISSLFGGGFDLSGFDKLKSVLSGGIGKAVSGLASKFGGLGSVVSGVASKAVAGVAAKFAGLKTVLSGGISSALGGVKTGLAVASKAAAGASGAMSGLGAAAGIGGIALAGFALKSVLASRKAKRMESVTKEVTAGFKEATGVVQNSTLTWGEWHGKGLVALNDVNSSTQGLYETLRDVGVSVKVGANGMLALGDATESTRQLTLAYGETVQSELASQLGAIEKVKSKTDEWREIEKDERKKLSEAWQESLALINDTSFQPIMDEFAAMGVVSADTFSVMAQDGMFTTDEITAAFGDMSGDIINEMNGASSVSTTALMDILGVGKSAASGIKSGFDSAGGEMSKAMIGGVGEIQTAINGLQGAVVHSVNEIENKYTGSRDDREQNSGFADGGISTGPMSGHTELLHGTEAVIPLKGGSIPVKMTGGGNESIGNKNIESLLKQLVKSSAQQAESLKKQINLAVKRETQAAMRELSHA